MVITVRGYLTFKRLIGEQELSFANTQALSLGDLVDLLVQMFGRELSDALLDPVSGGLSRQASLLINGRHYSHLPDKLNTLLKGGDEVAIFPPLAGG
jgi:molybdopterin converting factor small subunit